MPHIETALSNPGLLGRMLDWLRLNAQPGDGLADFSPEELRHMAEDLSLAQSDLLALSPRARDNTVLLEGMMRAHGFDPERMRPGFVTLLRDLERVCTLCKSTGRCRRELDAGTAATNCRQYCPNAATFDDLRHCAEVPAFP